MKIIVLLKEVPDTWGERRMDAATGRVDRGAGESVLDEIGERALEVAVSHRDANPGVEVIALAMGPAGAQKSLRKALAIGATSAVHVVDDELVGSDLLWTSAVLAAACRRIGFDLVIGGNESTDGRGGVLPAMLAEHLGVSQVTMLNSVEIGHEQVSGERAAEDGTLTVSGALPAVISVTERAPDARFPSFKGVMGAKKKPLESWSTGDLDLPDRAARSTVVSVTPRPPREGGVRIPDTGDAGVKIAEFLAERKLIG